ncbi:hypothetical protein TNCV_4859281 [Trichonephila clavipes]|nr:hypothetical protein TNCV_4859281 [Trichonephila clavipes]
MSINAFNKSGRQMGGLSTKLAMWLAVSLPRGLRNDTGTTQKAGYSGSPNGAKVAYWSWPQTRCRRVRALVPLKIRRVEGLMHNKSVEAQSTPTVVARFREWR